VRSHATRDGGWRVAPVTSRLLISEPALQVLPSLAEAVGLNGAIVLQQIHFRSMARNAAGEGWVQCSYTTWRRRDFPFWSDKTLKRTFTDLRDKGLIESDVITVDEGREMRVRLIMAAVEALEGSGHPDPRGSGHFDPTGRVTMGRPIGSDRPDPVTKEEEKQEGRAIALPGASALDRLPVDPAAALCQVLFEGVRAIDPAANGDPTSKAWVSQMRDVLAGRTVEDVRSLIEYGLGDSHFAALITTPAGLKRHVTPMAIRRGTDGGDEARGELCPVVDPLTGSVATSAIDRWREVETAIAGVIPQTSREMYLGAAHAHGWDAGTLLVGLPAHLAGHVNKRYADVLASAAGCPVQLVPCRDATERAA
jgi:hypothetical protein